MTRAKRDTSPEILMSRVVDGEATAADWESFRQIAESDPTLWREMAEHQRDHHELSAMVASAIAIADEVEAPAHAHMEQRMVSRLRIVGAWGGWAAAAAVALMWTAGQLNPTPTVPQNNTAGLNIPTGDLLSRYLEQGKKSGQVVGELPDKVLIETRPVQSGDGYEVYYIRQIIEKARVPDLYTFGTDDTGQAVPVRIEVVSPKPLGPT